MALTNQFKILSAVIITLIFSSHLITQTFADKECNSTIQLLSEIENENIFRLKIDEPLLSSNEKSSPQTCWFTIETFQDHGLKIEFEKFIFQEPECFNKTKDGCCDYLEIGTGLVVDQNTYQRYCGWLKIDPFILNSNRIWFKYNLENYDAFEGVIIKVKPFKLVFKNEKSGLIKTDSDYYNNMNLTYKIIMDKDSIINFNFINKFAMEKFANTCIDYIEIGELDSMLEPIGNATRFCGHVIPQQISINSNTAYVKLFTNENVLDTGFSLEFSSVKYLFTESIGTIMSPPKLMNIRYRITAPKDKKIELTITDFKFYPCINEDMEEVVRQISLNSNDICSINHHLIVSNLKGSLDNEFYDLFQNNPTSKSEWKFCDCYKPFKKFISLTNELIIENKLSELSSKYADALTKSQASYHINYRFIDYEFKESNQIRIVQDVGKLSPINGYLLRIRVAPGNHLRLYGKSNKCIMPTYTVLKKTHDSFKKINILKLQLDEFKANNCSYLFDLSEPKSDNQTYWYIEWFLKFNSPFDKQDFEVNWIFIKNLISEERKASNILLPAQFGFNISEELFFNFESQTSPRSYLVKLETIPSNTTSNDLSPIMITTLKRDQNSTDEYILPQAKIEQNSNIRTSDFKLDSVDSAIKVKRTNEWTYNINYKLESNDGDCDFDTSFCNYTNLDSNALIQHLPKYAAINTYYEQEVISKEFKDFYLSVSKLNKESDSNVTIYSPLIKVQSTEQPINSKILMLSFNYMMLNDSNAEIDLRMIPSRSEINQLADKYHNVSLKTLGKFFNQGKERITELTNVRMFSNLNECPIRSFSSFVNGLSTSAYEPVWHQVDKLTFFSCFDFKLAYDVKFEQTDSIIGLDDIQLDYGNELEECSSKDECNNHGTCLQLNASKICCCDAGYMGHNCEIEISPCDLFERNEVTICKNNGTCIDIDKNLNYKCDCQKGFSGEKCEIEINECDSNPCQNNGQCFDQIGSYKCVCQIGYNGTNCEIESPGCKEKCSNEGTLKCYENKKDQNILCKCSPGYSGDDCSKKIEINECDSNPCVGDDSKCVDLKNEFKCICSEKRTGKYCEQSLDYCNEFGHQCTNGSKCIYANNDGSAINCSCASGFTGRYCNETMPLNNCKPNPCNNGSCVALELGYKCDCPKGTIGRNCDKKPDYPCHMNKCVHGYCIDLTATDYTCSCYGTYTGEFCDKELCNKDNYINDYCVKENTLDVVKDPLFEDKNKCLCLCKNGFKGSRCEIKENICELVEERDISSYGSQCQNGGKCTYDSETNKLKCLCINGYFGDRCQQHTNHCQNNPCKYGTCSSLEDKYVCKCTNGWEGTNCDQEKQMCVLEDECEGNNTLSVKYSYSSNECVCMCKMGFEGKRCEINFDDCKDNKCKHNAQCIDHVGSYECKCPAGYMGVFCESKIEKCFSFPCKNGTCEETSVGFTCHCDKGFTGELCETLIDKCDPNPCNNGATCHNLISDYYCECPPEFGSSRNCTERSIDPCITSPCLNNATCTALSTYSKEKSAPVFTGFNCKCPTNYRGTFCEQPSDICSSNPCKNHGRCTIPKENPNDFKCLCFPAFTGKSCEFLFDECASVPCFNGGTCLPSPEGFKCKCPFNFDGKTCETQLGPCDFMNCLNGGKCKVGHKNVPYCECLDKRYTGTQCEIDLSLLSNETEIVKFKASSLELDNRVKCDILGNDVTFIDYVFTTMMLFFLLIIIIVVVYVYVQLNIRRVKRLIKEANFASDLSSEALSNN